MMKAQFACAIGAAAVIGVVAIGDAQTAPARQGGPARSGTPIPGANEPPKLIFHEGWTRAPLAQPITQENLANQNLTLHIYGDANQIRKAMHPLDDYTYTGETTTNWALTVSDKTSLWDVTAAARSASRPRTPATASCTSSSRPPTASTSRARRARASRACGSRPTYIFQDLHWRNLLMTDTPSNASNRRQPDPKRVPIIPTSKGTPDLTQIDEVGFSDLMEGGWIPATSRVAAFELYGKAVPRKQ